MINIWLNRALSVGLNYRSMIILIILSFSATIAEIFGISMFLPIFQFIQLNGDISALSTDTEIWPYIVEFFSYIGISLSLGILLLVAFSLLLVRQVITYIRLVYQASLYYHLVKNIRNRMFSGYLRSNSSYHDDMPIGNFVNVITTEVISGVTGIIGPVSIVVHILTLAGYISILLLLSWEMTVFSLIALSLASVVSRSWLRQSAIVGRKFVNANVLMSEFLVDRLRSPRLVRLSRTEELEISEFKKLTKEQRNHIVSISVLSAKTNVIMEPIVIGFSLLFIYVSVSNLEINIEIIGLYLLIILRLMPIIKSIIVKLQSLQKNIGSIEIVENRLKDIESSVEDDFGRMDLYAPINNICFKNVSYKYPSSKEYAIKNISCEIGENMITAIVGPSGSGKSTLIDLLPRIRLPNNGVVQINNIDIQEYSIRSIREKISFAPQYAQIFNGTIKDHILYGKLDATDKEVNDVIKLSGINNFVNSLPSGIDTLIGEDATKLSGGQRQRLDLARALISKSSILILDEPTSNLDAKSEREFHTVLDNIKKETNMIIIVITHRLVNILNADKIIVLNNGKIEDMGTHDDLLNGNSWYADVLKKI